MQMNSAHSDIEQVKVENIVQQENVENRSYAKAVTPISRLYSIQ